MELIPWIINRRQLGYINVYITSYSQQRYRRKVLTSEIQVRCKEIIESLQSDDFLVIELEVMPEHVHLLFSTNPQVDLKASSITVDEVEVYCDCWFC